MGAVGIHDNGLDYVEFDGHRRILACLPPPRPNLAALPSVGDVVPLIPRSDWMEISLSHLNVPIYDQDGLSSCVGNSSAGAFSRAWRRAGGDAHQFSASYIYSLINGGRDAGASIGDAIDVLMSDGTCLESECPQDRIYRRLIPAAAVASAQRFRVLAGYHCRSFDEVATAIQLWGVAVFAVYVAGDFDRLDADGCPPFHRGIGNHAVHGQGLRRLPSGEWLIETVNSWGERFGRGGTCCVRESHVDDIGYQDAYTITAAATDPQEIDLPPAVPA